MITGSELRNSFNRTMRELYSIKDSSQSGVSGRSGTTSINSKSYIDIYINICYDIISNYERENEVSENNIISFLEEFQNSTTHFLDNPIQENTRVEAKSIIKEYLDEIKSNYESYKVHKVINKTNETIQNFEKVDLMIKHRGEKEKKSFTQTYSKKKEKKKPISKKAIRGQHNTSYSKSSDEIIQDVQEVDRDKTPFGKKESFFSKIFSKKILIILVLLIVGYFALTNYQSFIPKQQVEVINETNKTQVDEVLEKPQAPIIEEFTLSQLEQDVIDLINEKRVRYGHEEYEINLPLSELGEDYLQVKLNEDVEVAKDKIGDLTERREKANAPTNIRESYFDYEVYDENIAKSLVDKIWISNLYSKEMKGIGIAIIQKKNKYHILINIY